MSLLQHTLTTSCHAACCLLQQNLVELPENIHLPAMKALCDLEAAAAAAENLNPDSTSIPVAGSSSSSKRSSKAMSRQQKPLPDNVAQAMLAKRNPSQARAVTAVASGEGPFVLVQGPPGTGKTATMSTVVATVLYTHSNAEGQGPHVLMTAQTNAAAAGLYSRVVKECGAGNFDAVAVGSLSAMHEDLKPLHVTKRVSKELLLDKTVDLQQLYKEDRAVSRLQQQVFDVQEWLEDPQHQQQQYRRQRYKQEDLLVKLQHDFDKSQDEAVKQALREQYGRNLHAAQQQKTYEVLSSCHVVSAQGIRRGPWQHVDPHSSQHVQGR